MNKNEDQISSKMSQLPELSPHDRVLDRIFASVEHDKRRTKYVQATSLGAFLVVSAFVGFGYLLFLHDSNEEPKSEGQPTNLVETGTQDGSNSSTAIHPLSEILEMSSRFYRRSAMYRFVDTTDAPALRDLLKQAEEIRDRQLREEVQEIVVLKLSSLDSIDAIAQLEVMEDERRSTLTEVVFQEQSLSDLDGAVAFAEGIDSLGRAAALKGIYDSRKDMSRDRWNAIAFKLADQRVINNIMAESLARVAIEAPDEALQSFLSMHGGALNEDAQVQLFEHISRALIDMHGPRAALRRVDLAIGSNRYRGRVFNVFFDELRKDDPELAVRLGVEMSHGDDEMVGGGVVLGWAFYDPLGALKSALSIQDVEQRKMVLQAYPLSGAAEEIPEQILATIDNYSDEGTGRVVRRAIRALAKKSPEIAVRHFYRISDEAERLELAKDLAKTWSRSDALAALNWINTSDEVQDLRQRLIPVAISELVYEDPQLALQTALELETPDLGIGPEAGVMEELAKSDVNMAIGMLRNARNEMTKLSAAQSIGRALIRDGESERAMEVAKELLKSSQDAYFESLLGSWARSDGLGLLKSIHRLPNAEIRESAAGSLLNSHRSKNGIRLTKEQEAEVLSFLSEEELSEAPSSLDELQDWEYVLFRN